MLRNVFSSTAGRPASPTRTCSSLACAGSRNGAGRRSSCHVGIGIALGHATLGTIGNDGLFTYAAIGTVTNLAARLSDAAGGDQILISARVHAAVEHRIQSEPLGPLQLKGFARPVPAFNVLGRRD